MSEEIVKLATNELVPMWSTEKQKLDDIDKWARWDHQKPTSPQQATTEHKQLAERAQVPWGDLVVTSIAQTLYAEGYRRSDDPDNAAPWRTWQANGMDARQTAVYRTALTYGISYGTALPGVTVTGERLAQMRGVSPRQMIALYEDVAWDDWPQVAMRVVPLRRNLDGAAPCRVLVFDDEYVYTLVGPDGPSGKLAFEKAEKHGAGVCPVVRFVNRFDLEGRSAGEVEPFVPLMGSIDQTKYDRMVVQRFTSWVVRTIAGMAIDETVKATGKSEAEVKLAMQIGDILIAKDKDTKFGSLPATPLTGFIDAYDADVKVLAAVSQTPAHEMLGMMANLSAEALAAAKASQTAKSVERQHGFGEANEQWLRLAAWIDGDAAAAEDFEAEIRWADTEIRSLAQAADALGKLAQMLGVPVELLWEKIPGFTQQDVERAKSLVQNGEFEQLIANLNQQATPEPSPAPNPAPV